MSGNNRNIQNKYIPTRGKCHPQHVRNYVEHCHRENGSDEESCEIYEYPQQSVVHQRQNNIIILPPPYIPNIYGIMSSGTNIIGPPGPTGAAGSQGIAGATGGSGTTGYNGLQGLTGATGFQGAQGLQGLYGTQGVTGAEGKTGYTGVQGAQGVTGPSGQTGTRGDSGTTGFTGPMGETGSSGARGETGIGITGATGVGATGFTGFTGTVGPYTGFAKAYNYDTTTTAGDPGSGKLRLSRAWNDQNAGTVFIYVDVNDADGRESSGWFNSMLTYGSSGYYGTINLQVRSDASRRWLGQLTDVANSSGYYTLTVIYSDYDNVAYNGEQLIMTFSGAGRLGATGPSNGPTGSTGPTGTQGVTGSSGARGETGLGVTGSSGATGIQGAIGYQGVTGTQGAQGATGIQGAIGYQGVTGTQGSTGFSGATGSAGAIGPGMATFDYLFNTNTSAANPGKGKYSLNNASMSSATILYINSTDAAGLGNILTPFYAALNNYGNSANRGFIKIQKRDDYTWYQVYEISTVVQSQSGNTGYYSITINNISPDDNFSNNDPSIISFNLAGPAGVTGNTGNAGSQGTTGFTGFTGMNGNSTLTGSTGATGSAGFTGFTGATGERGADSIYIPGGYTWDTVNSSNSIIYTTNNRITTNNASSIAAYIQSPTLNNIVGGVLSWTYTPNGTFLGRFAVGLSTVRTNDINRWSYLIYNDNNNCYTKDNFYFSVSVTDTLGIEVTSTSINYYKTSGIVRTVANTTGGLPLYACFYIQDTTSVIANISFVQNFNPYMMGSTGFTGIQGLEGAIGFTGFTGIQGAQGAIGFTGFTGIQGAQGAIGFTGFTGIQGAQGLQGAQGAQGIQGTIGFTGFTGIQGAQGAIGSTGSTGTQGAQGNQGITGAASTLTGPTGIAGYATTLTPSSAGVIPTMTGYTTGGFTISASSEFSGSYAAWFACDASSSSEWAQFGTGAATWQVQCPSPIAIWQIQISKRYSPGEYYTTFYFEGSSNGGISWTTLIYSSGALNAVGMPPSVLTLQVNDPTYTPYSLYRIRPTASVVGTSNGGFAIFQMYAYTQANTTATGATGISGQTGFTGAQGAQGMQGTQGVTGITGSSATSSTWSQYPATQLVNMGGYGLTGFGGITTSYTGFANLNLAGTNTRGGSSQFDFLLATNTTAGATAPSKTFRITSTGQFQIINNAYTTPTLFSLEDSGNLTIPSGLILNSGINYNSFSGFIYAGGSNPYVLTSSQNGYFIQMVTNITLPLCSLVSLGGKFTFANHSSSTYTITVSNTGTEFIYNGGSLGTGTRNLTIQAGETLEIMSRGNTEWDVTGGSAAMRYQTTPPILKTSAINQAAGTTVAMNTIKAYMATDGTLWLGSNTGSNIFVYGQAQWTFYGSAGSGSTISLTNLNSLVNATNCPTSGNRGDLMVAVVTDITNNSTYRITGQQTGTAKTGNYSIIIEQL